MLVHTFPFFSVCIFSIWCYNYYYGKREIGMYHVEYIYNTNEDTNTEEYLIELAIEKFLDEYNIEGTIFNTWQSNEFLHIVVKG
jgi:hypothetical protein